VPLIAASQNFVGDRQGLAADNTKNTARRAHVTAWIDHGIKWLTSASVDEV